MSSTSSALPFGVASFAPTTGGGFATSTILGATAKAASTTASSGPPLFGSTAATVASPLFGVTGPAPCQQTGGQQFSEPLFGASGFGMQGSLGFGPKAVGVVVPPPPPPPAADREQQVAGSTAGAGVWPSSQQPSA